MKSETMNGTVAFTFLVASIPNQVERDVIDEDHFPLYSTNQNDRLREKRTSIDIIFLLDLLVQVVHWHRNLLSSPIPTVDLWI